MIFLYFSRLKKILYKFWILRKLSQLLAEFLSIVATGDG
ncbi:hypothetical protein COO91_07037 [Nostoc flagelliforme CCNUN1]|uniref:Uncharacterized protein n=1 Tax=Nostoc flagelliforme CCNUN1 TaxID=2038116 RepID=A0A2K8T001_9NOSO|nr:hypothetical protein COO91_07037 [Nostoc flagelliforme CCNUN1]